MAASKETAKKMPTLPSMVIHTVSVSITVAVAVFPVDIISVALVVSVAALTLMSCLRA